MKSAEQEDIEKWKIKRMMEKFSKMRGTNGATSVITLLLPKDEQIHKINALLTTEYGTASNIKSRVNRLSVLSAISSAQQKLKLFNSVPNRGLVLLCGTVDTPKGEKKVSIAFEPPRPVPRFLYLCDSVFHLEDMVSSLEDNTRYGFLIVDGEGALFMSVCGSAKEQLTHIEVKLPPKHGRGGQSKLRFERLAEESRHNYLNKVAETAKNIFLTNDRANVECLFIAGAAYLKDRLVRNDFLDPRILKIVSQPIFTVSYGGENGFSEALSYAKERMGRSKLAQQEEVLETFFNLINRDEKRYCFGKRDVMIAMELGIVEKLLLAEECKEVLDVIPEEVKEHRDIKDADDVGLIEYMLAFCEIKNVSPMLISSSTTLGSQFLKGFGGMGGILRYAYDFTEYDQDEGEEQDDLDFI